MAALKAELDERWTLRRDVVKHLTAAAAEGDRSENAEYIYRKKQLREIGSPYSLFATASARTESGRPLERGDA